MTSDVPNIRALLVMEQCNPEWPSVPLVGYNLFKHLSERVAVTLVTHGRNEKALRSRHPNSDIVFIPETKATAAWHRLATRLSTIRGHTVWQLYHTLTYPTYAEFDGGALKAMRPRIEAGEFDVVHAITPMMPRYPFSIRKACRNVPFVIGPVNGGVPYPKGFQSVARSEFAYMNALRAVGRRLIPGYKASYEAADHIFSGSQFTKALLEGIFKTKNPIEILAENGLDRKYLSGPDDSPGAAGTRVIDVLFAGRLVPYKGADIAVDAIAALDPQTRERLHFTIVGDGPERPPLETQIHSHGLGDKITLAGWINHNDIAARYRAADVFCFPSIREFGGAVVLEAMASGLPCIVINNGGVAEYVSSAAGVIIEPISREQVVSEVARALTALVTDTALRQRMSEAARARAQLYTWEEKAKLIVDRYRTLIARRAAATSAQRLGISPIAPQTQSARAEATTQQS